MDSLPIEALKTATSPWSSMLELKMAMTEDFSSLMSHGLAAEDARIAIAAALAVRRDDLLAPAIALGLVESLLAGVVATRGSRH